MTLAAGAFVARTDNLAQDSNDRIIFRRTDRTLWYDTDGNGSVLAYQFAVVSGTAVLTVADFGVINIV